MAVNPADDFFYSNNMNKINHTIRGPHPCEFVHSFRQVVNYCNSIVLSKVPFGAFCNINDKINTCTCKFTRATVDEGENAPGTTCTSFTNYFLN